MPILTLAAQLRNTNWFCHDNGMVDTVGGDAKRGEDVIQHGFLWPDMACQIQVYGICVIYQPYHTVKVAHHVAVKR